MPDDEGVESFRLPFFLVFDLIRSALGVLEP